MGLPTKIIFLTPLLFSVQTTLAKLGSTHASTNNATEDCISSPRNTSSGAQVHITVNATDPSASLGNLADASSLSNNPSSFYSPTNDADIRQLCSPTFPRSSSERPSLQAWCPSTSGRSELPTPPGRHHSPRRQQVADSAHLVSPRSSDPITWTDISPGCERYYLASPGRDHQSENSNRKTILELIQDWEKLDNEKSEYARLVQDTDTAFKELFVRTLRENDALRAEQERFDAVKGELWAENARLRKRNSQLEAENSRLLKIASRRSHSNGLESSEDSTVSAESLAERELTEHDIGKIQHDLAIKSLEKRKLQLQESKAAKIQSREIARLALAAHGVSPRRGRNDSQMARVFRTAGGKAAASNLRLRLETRLEADSSGSSSSPRRAEGDGFDSSSESPRAVVPRPLGSECPRLSPRRLGTASHLNVSERVHATTPYSGKSHSTAVRENIKNGLNPALMEGNYFYKESKRYGNLRDEEVSK